MSRELPPPPSRIDFIKKTGEKAENSREWTTWLNSLFEWLKENMSKNFFFEVVKGNIKGHSIVHKFGHNDSVSTTLVPVCAGGVYQTPTSAVTLELVSSNANDNQAGTGARSITIQGLDANFDLQTVTANMHATDGTIAEVVTGYTWMRIFRAYVETTGTYATATAGSHAGTITLRVSGGGATYGVIELHGGFPVAQTLIGAYTIPKGKTGYIGDIDIETDSNQTIDIYLLKRENANDVTAPYSAMRAQGLYTGIPDVVTLGTTVPLGPFNEYTDVGFMAVASAGTVAVSVDFEIILVDN